MAKFKFQIGESVLIRSSATCDIEVLGTHGVVQDIIHSKFNQGTLYFNYAYLVRAKYGAYTFSEDQLDKVEE